MQSEVISQVSGPFSQVDAEEYLVSLETLARELDRAMDAVVAKALPCLEESLIRQRSLCARLAHSPARQLLYAANVSGSKEAPIDAELASRITAASAALLLLNDRYSALLKHSGDTLRLFARLFRSYSGPRQKPGERQASQHTWSCEL